MGKQINPNLGHGVCLIAECREVVPFRRNRSGKWYFDCPVHGRITPNLPGGQEAIMDRAVIWGPDGPTPDCPRWIAENRALLAASDPKARQPIGQGDDPPAPTPTPTARPAPPPPPAPPAPEPGADDGTGTEPQPEPEPERESGGGFFDW